MSQSNTNTVPGRPVAGTGLQVNITNPAPLKEVLAAQPGDAVNCSLTDLMNRLVEYTDPTPCYIFTSTIPDMNKKSRANKDILNPFEGKIVKLTQQLVRVNDDYEQAVIRRQLFEARERGETLKVDDQFIADHPKWGSKVGTSDMPNLFEWWIPQGEKDVKWYLVVRPTQHLKTWYEWSDSHDKAKFGKKLTDLEYADLKANYLRERDDDQDADRQGVDKPVLWRKYTFTNVLQMTIGKVRYNVVDSTLPTLKPKQLSDLLAAVKDAATRRELRKRSK